MLYFFRLTQKLLNNLHARWLKTAPVCGNGKSTQHAAALLVRQRKLLERAHIKRVRKIFWQFCKQRRRRRALTVFQQRTGSQRRAGLVSWFSSHPIDGSGRSALVPVVVCPSRCDCRGVSVAASSTRECVCERCVLTQSPEFHLESLWTALPTRSQSSAVAAALNIVFAKCQFDEGLNLWD